MADFLTYWHTLRYLKPVQLYGRLWARLYKPRLNLFEAPAVRVMDGIWNAPARRGQSLFESFRFRFLNEEHLLTDIGWDSPNIEKLWRYNLHYFDDLNAEGAEFRTGWHRELLARWVAENPPAGGTAWEPYPTSVRIVNWIKWSLAGNKLPPECLHSLAVQVRWLAGKLEVHLLGNHLFANAKALVFAGLFFCGQEAEGWLSKGLQILEREMPEQIMADGGQFERSTMYHALAQEDMLDLYNLTGAFCSEIPERWATIITNRPGIVGQMRRWLAVMSHPDGEISFFNDAAIGIAPAPAELERYAGRLALPDLAVLPDGVTHLPESGYIRVQKPEMVALIDVAQVGPDYLPGHAHADTLSFELSLFGQRILVNSGTSCYGNSAERLRQRGTASHNTVEVDGFDSSEVWGGFRVARRAYPTELKIAEHDGCHSISCAHDGYRWLPGKPKHLRKWLFSDRKFVVEDRIEGGFSQAIARLFLHPSISISAKMIEAADSTILELESATGQTIRVTFQGGTVRVVDSAWHPEFGKTESNICILLNFNSPMLQTTIEWTDPA